MQTFANLACLKDTSPPNPNKYIVVVISAVLEAWSALGTWAQGQDCLTNSLKGLSYRGQRCGATFFFPFLFSFYCCGCVSSEAVIIRLLDFVRYHLM